MRHSTNPKAAMDAAHAGHAEEPEIARIPVPEVLDRARIVAVDADSESLAEQRDLNRRVTAALEASCSYGRQLWHQLQATREYLVAALPPDRSAQPIAARRGTKPESASDDTGWSQWMDAYAGLTAILAGPAGDAGHARSEARRIAQNRRA
jgi:hypothetical protein